MPFNDISVVEIVADWVFNITKDGQTGTRAFIDAAKLPDSDATVLPSVGDEWNSSFPACRCTDIEIIYINGNDNCGKKYICNYNTKPKDNSSGLTNDVGQTSFDDDSPIRIDMSSELISYEPTGEGEIYTAWYNGGTYNTSVTQPIYKVVSIANITINRDIYKELDGWMELSFNCMGKLNSNTKLGSFKNIPQGMLLYNGANLIESRTSNGTKYWKAELSFSYRTVTNNPGLDDKGNPKDGWQFILNESNGKWDMPYYIPEDRFLYEYADFSQLLTSFGYGVEFPDIVNLRTLT